MRQLSEHFFPVEFTCHCGCGFGLQEGDVSQKLIDALEKLRWLCCQIKKVDVPLVVVSGARCKKHNSSKRVGGAPNSRHLVCDAADIKAYGIDPGALYSIAKQIPQFRDGGLGVYKTWLHVDTRGYRARW